MSISPRNAFSKSIKYPLYFPQVPSQSSNYKSSMCFSLCNVGSGRNVSLGHIDIPRALQWGFFLSSVASEIGHCWRNTKSLANSGVTVYAPLYDLGTGCDWGHPHCRGGWTGWLFKVPSNPNYPTILWFCPGLWVSDILVLVPKSDLLCWGLG